MTAVIHRVVISRVGGASYPTQAPFLAGQPYPEFAGRTSTGAANPVYDAVRRLLWALRLDVPRVGTTAWNPLGDLVKPGMRVLVKPNWILHVHRSGGPVEAVITHGSLLAAVVDYVSLALQGDGEITIGDAPIQYADFPSILRLTGAEVIAERARLTWGVAVRIVDFRRSSAEKRADGSVRSRHALKGDDRGYQAVRLDERSRLVAIDGGADRYRVTNYNPEEMRLHHGNGRHEYLVTRSLLQSDVLINLPKMKTHRKAGVTLSLKNMVGINGDKDWLPHHRAGSSSEGGDEYAHYSWRKSVNRWLSERADSHSGPLSWLALSGLKRVLRVTRRLLSEPDPYSEGSWHGNDTLWRMVHDLNAIALYGRDDGSLDPAVRRGYLTIIDGVQAGDGDGPIRPRPRHEGVLFGGLCPATVDEVAVRHMGFSPAMFPIIAHAQTRDDLPVRLASQYEMVETAPGREERTLQNVPTPATPWEVPAGWGMPRREVVASAPSTGPGGRGAS